MLNVHLIASPAEQEEAFAIRRRVFVEEQKVPAEQEYDQFESSARHFLAHWEELPCGTSRYRYTDKGIKLERFAVLPAFRARRVGAALLEAMLSDIATQTQPQPLYLHAQVTAMGFYRKFGFEAVGELFYECDIAHYKMVMSYEL